MPILINEVTAEVPQPPVPKIDSHAVSEAVPLSQPEYEFLQTLDLIEERRARLEFD
ncbi:MAG: hypothetical protein PVG22_01535 [Chromatiales bacterium]|jgi:hypothetical protein